LNSTQIDSLVAINEDKLPLPSLIVRYVRFTIDLESKRLCSDDISQASCEKDSPVKSKIEEKISQEPLQIRPDRERPLDEYYLFRIQLIPPGGEMIVVAKDFDLVILE